MPIDPRIPLGVQPLQLPSPLEIYSTVQQIQGQREAVELRRQAAEEARARRAEAQQQREQQQAIDQALQAAIKIDDKTGRITFDRQTLLAGVPATVAYKLQKELDDDEVSANTLAKSLLELEGTKREYRGSIGRTIRAGQYAPGVFRPLMRGAHGFGALDDELATQYEALEDPAAIQAVVDDWVAQGGGKPPGLERVETVDAQGRKVTKFVEPTAGAEFPTAAPVTAPPHVGSFEDYVLRRFGPQPTAEQITQARKDYGQADDRPTVTVQTGQPDDVRTIVQGMMDGTLPPQLPGRASPLYNAIMAEAQRRGFNLAGAVTDWVATQKHVATMNGAQQLRLNQAVNALPEMLDSVESLAKQWKGGGFPLLNRANLALAKGGALGPKAAAIANQLDAQIADVVADLGNVYMGGNSPTDHALSLAGKSLSADWSEEVLLKMVALAKKNVQIRRNSINSTGVAGASADNPYDVPPPAAPVGDQEGAVKPIPGYPGTEQTFRGGKWIRTK